MEQSHKDTPVFVSLAPVVKNDENDVYQQALDFCLHQSDISNIALAGPYGSGKSSILKGLKSRKGDQLKILEISLASFKHENAKSELQAKDIEFSILQQMLYSEEANKLPYSRFKRIKSPDKVYEKSGAITLWLASVFVLFHAWKKVFSFELWSPEFFLFWAFMTCFALGTGAIIHKLYKTFYGIPLKKLSLKNIELETDSNDSSILNKHLDEILYFFEKTDYKLVAFEDIDRFDSPEIFIKLREINTIINGSDSVTQQVQFLYSIKESMFSERERTKFFDFIIPVVPVIGTNNSGDLMRDRSAKLADLHIPINPEFIKDVAEYLNDARLIHNTFNELYIYQNAINDSKVDTTNLFAIMLYKNVFGHDFEALHDKKGALYNIVNQKEVLIEKRKQYLNNKIHALNTRLKKADELFIRSESQLASLYISAILKKADSEYLSIYIQDAYKHLANLTIDDIEILCSEDQVITNRPSHNYSPVSFNFSDVEANVVADESFTELRQMLRDRDSSQQAKIKAQINTLRQIDIPKAESLRLKALLEEEPDIINEYVKEYSKNNDIMDIGLFRFLLLSGYLNEDYAIYISIFREQSDWTKNDREFYKAIKSRFEISPSQIVDNPLELLARFTPTNIIPSYLLNVYVFDGLLKQSNKEPGFLSTAVDYLQNVYLDNEGQTFIAHYLSSGNHVREYFTSLLEHWPGFIKTCVQSPQASLEIAMLLTHVDFETILHSGQTKVLESYLERMLDTVYVNELFEPPGSDSYTYLYEANIKVRNIQSVYENSDLYSYLIEHQLFSINLGNIHNLLDYMGSDTDASISRTYTQIVSLFAPASITYVEDNIDAYITDVMLQSSPNIEETEESIYRLIELSSISDDSIKSILTHQSHIFQNLNRVDESLWQFILEMEKVVFSWDTAIKCANSESVDNDVLLNFLIEQPLSMFTQIDQTLQKSDAVQYFAELIEGSDSLPDDVYITVLKGLRCSLPLFPDVSEHKWLKLAEQSLVKLSVESYEQIISNDEIALALVLTNSDAFVREIEQYIELLSSEVVVELLASDVSKEFKVKLVQNISLEMLEGSDELTNLVSPLYLQLSDDDLDEDILNYLMWKTDSESLSLTLIRRYFELYPNEELLQPLLDKVNSWSESTIMTILKLMPSPYSEIANYGKRPKLILNKQTELLLEKLRDRRFISSFRYDNGGLRVRTKSKALS